MSKQTGASVAGVAESSRETVTIDTKSRGELVMLRCLGCGVAVGFAPKGDVALCGKCAPKYEIRRKDESSR